MSDFDKADEESGLLLAYIYFQLFPNYYMKICCLVPAF